MDMAWLMYGKAAQISRPGPTGLVYELQTSSNSKIPEIGVKCTSVASRKEHCLLPGMHGERSILLLAGSCISMPGVEAVLADIGFAGMIVLR